MADSGDLFLCTLPGILIFTLPMGVLVGVLIALGRMSADSELIAMSALGSDAAVISSNWDAGRGRNPDHFLHDALAWTSVRSYLPRTGGPLAHGQASFQVAPRVFDERFPRLVLYVNDIDSTATRGKASSCRDGRSGCLTPHSGEEAIVIADRTRASWSYTFAMEVFMNLGQRAGNYSLSAFAARDLPVEARGLEAAPHPRHPFPDAQ